ncbi:MAG: hypothetical protein ACR2IE_04075 [Candidatus Sumerlaeaceae bacterium]
MKPGFQKQRGFALITALGVLALLMIMAFGAASVTQFTFSLSQARLTDRSYGDMLREGAELLQMRGVPEEGTPTVEVLRAQSLSRRDVQVSATVQQLETGRNLLGTALTLRNGDRVVELTAAPTSTGRISRGAVYLLNVQGARNAPILLLERRP